MCEKAALSCVVAAWHGTLPDFWFTASCLPFPVSRGRHCSRRSASCPPTRTAGRRLRRRLASARRARRTRRRRLPSCASSRVAAGKRNARQAEAAGSEAAPKKKNGAAAPKADAILAKLAAMKGVAEDDAGSEVEESQDSQAD